MPRPLPQRTRSRFWLIALIPILLSLLTGVMVRHYQQTVSDADQAQELRRVTAELLSALKDAETGQRGYLLTGDQRYREPFENAIPAIDRQMGRLTDLTREMPSQRRLVAALRPWIARKVDELTQVLEAYDRGGLAAALAIVREDRGHEAMERVRELVTSLEGELRAEGTRAAAARQRAAMLLLVSFGLGSALTVWLLWSAQRIIAQHLRDREVAYHTLQSLNASLEQRVAERTADLHRSNQELQQFAYLASHDLQEPLRMVASYVKLLARRYQGRLDKDADEYIGFAVDGAERMQQLVANLLQLSRLESEGVERQPTDVRSIYEQVVQGLRAAIEEKQADVSAGPLPEVLANPPQLAQLLQNLIANALKFHAPGTPPHVRVSAQREDEAWRISVRDHGIGIPADQQERIFALFARLHGRQEYAGSGLGLAICKRLVEAQGGRIWVESLPGEGATFHFTLQAVPTPATDHPKGLAAGTG